MNQGLKKQGGTRGQALTSSRVFLRGSDGEPLGGVLGWLASLMGLDVYKTSLLGQRTRIEMQAAALMLAVIFVFDVGAWTLLFNTLLHAEILRIDGWSVLSLLAGLLFAAAILLYERQFFTADLWDGWRRVAIPMSVRLAIIIMAAAVTAQPVELLFFKEAIAQRAHEEGIREEVVTRRKEGERIQKERDELRTKIDALGEKIKKEIEYGRHEEAVKKVADLEAEEILKTNEVASAERSVVYWRGEVARRRSVAAQARGTDQGDAALGAVRSALASQQTALARLESRRAALRQVQSRLPGAKSDETAANERLQARRRELERLLEERIQAVEGREQRIERWVRQLRQARPGDNEPIVEFAPTQGGSNTSATVSPPSASVLWRYNFPDYHFFRQLRVLKDLRAGNPPRWPGASDAKDLARAFGLEDIQPCSTRLQKTASVNEDPCDDDAWIRMRQETQLYFWSWLVVYAVSFVIPLLVIAMKFLMTPELKAYYSARCQALAGNPDAIAFQRIAAEAVLEELNTRADKGIFISQAAEAEAEI